MKIVVDDYKAIPRYGLEKVPDSVLLKQANVEIGQLKSYILELEYRISEMSKLLNNHVRFKDMESQINNLRKENKILRKRKGDSATDINIQLSYEDRVRLRECVYKNELCMGNKRQLDFYKNECLILNRKLEDANQRCIRLVQRYGLG